MKLKLILKDPDGVSNSIDRAIEDHFTDYDGDPDDLDAAKEAYHEKIMEAVNRWIEYEEYAQIEIDTDANTATVIAPR